MKTVLGNIESIDEPLACSIGNFDGIHTGHLKVLKILKSEAEKRGLKTAVITFYPHPRKVLKRENLCRIINLKTKEDILKNLGIDYLIVIDFSPEFASKTKDEFIEFLKEKLNCRLLVVGEDWRFGKNREGDIQYLRKTGINVIPVEKEKLDGEKISSSQIRKLLKEGKVEEVSKILGRPYCIKGKTVKGKGLGRQIGFPTINVDPQEELCLRFGVYAGRIIIDGRQYKAAINFGKKPTVENLKRPIIEVHIVEPFSIKKLPEYITVCFDRFIRDEKKFNSLEELIFQIKKDVELIKRIEFGGKVDEQIT